jgi:hypothetical protein
VKIKSEHVARCVGVPKPIVLPTHATDTRISLRNHPVCAQLCNESGCDQAMLVRKE